MSSSRKSRIASSMSDVMFTNAVYFPNYRIYQGDTPGMLNYSCINHVYYAYASVSADGGVFVSSFFKILVLTPGKKLTRIL
jgi:chitinase